MEVIGTPQMCSHPNDHLELLVSVRESCPDPSGFSGIRQVTGVSAGREAPCERVGVRAHRDSWARDTE